MRDSGVGDDVVDVEGEAGVREDRRVSWRPGADGAPLEVDEEMVLFVEVEWLEWGAMRRDCRRGISKSCTRNPRAGHRADHPGLY